MGRRAGGGRTDQRDQRAVLGLCRSQSQLSWDGVSRPARMVRDGLRARPEASREVPCRPFLGLSWTVLRAAPY